MNNTPTVEEVKKQIEMIKQEVLDKEAVLKSLLEQLEELTEDEN